MPADRTPLGDEMDEKLPGHGIPTAGEVPPPDNVPPVNNPDPQPGDPKPRAPQSDDEPGRRTVPVELPGVPHAPERA